MDTATTIALINANNAAQQAAIDSARRASCIQWMPSFDAANATAEQARMYADCVSRVYPAPMPEWAILWLKLGVIVCIIGPVVGALTNEFDAVEGALLGFLIPLALWLIISLLVGVFLIAG